MRRRRWRVVCAERRRQRPPCGSGDDCPPPAAAATSPLQCLDFSPSHCSETSFSAAPLLLSDSVALSVTHTHTRRGTNLHSHTWATLFMSLKISHTYFHRNKEARTMAPPPTSVIKLPASRSHSKIPRKPLMKIILGGKKRKTQNAFRVNKMLNKKLTCTLHKWGVKCLAAGWAGHQSCIKH